MHYYLFMNVARTNFHLHTGNYVLEILMLRIIPYFYLTLLSQLKLVFLLENTVLLSSRLCVEKLTYQLCCCEDSNASYHPFSVNSRTHFFLLNNKIIIINTHLKSKRIFLPDLLPLISK